MNWFSVGYLREGEVCILGLFEDLYFLSPGGQDTFIVRWELTYSLFSSLRSTLNDWVFIRGVGLPSAKVTRLTKWTKDNLMEMDTGSYNNDVKFLTSYDQNSMLVVDGV